MKNYVLTFLLGVFVAISIAATTTNLMTVVPATPKEVTIETFTNGYNIQDDVKNHITAMTKKGYLLKSMMMTNESPQRAIVVMEKY